MLAIRAHEYGGPEVLRLDEAPTPEPKVGEVRVKLCSAGVNPVDTYIRAGSYALKPPLPWVPGLDGAGVVEAVGPGVARWKEGDRVFLAATSLVGTYAQACVCGARDLGRLPAHVSFEEGAALWVSYGTAYRALFEKGAARPGDRVLIHGGSGGVGTAAVQMAAAAGLKVVATASTEEGRALLLAQGADLAIPHVAPEQAEAAKALYGGFDLIVEMAAHQNLATDLELVATDGRVVIVGSRGEVALSPRRIMAQECEVTGFSLFQTIPKLRMELVAAIEAGLRARTLRPIVGRALPLAQAAQAHREVMGPEGRAGKIVLTIPA